LKNFVRLFETLPQVKEPAAIINLLDEYFGGLSTVEEKDATLKLLLGITPKKVITTKQLKLSASRLTGYPDWLVERSEAETGKFITAFALLLRSGEKSSDISLGEWMKMISNLPHSQETDVHEFVLQHVSGADPGERQILLKLLTGTFKSSVYPNLIQKTVARILNISPTVASLRLHELAHKNQVSYQRLGDAIDSEDKKIPTEFPLINTINAKFDNLDNPGDWKAFGKKDGLGAQLVKYENSVYLWSSEYEIITNKFPEIVEDFLSFTGDFKIHGQIISKNPASAFDNILSRLNKKIVPRNEISRFPATFEVWSISDQNRHAVSEKLVMPQISFLTPIKFSSWTELNTRHKNCRKDGYSAILLRHQNVTEKYLFFKAPSFTINAVLTYLEFGGINESGIKSMTFGVLNKGEVIPIGKIDAPFEHLDCEQIATFARENTLERFGPVRTLRPELVFELHFDGIVSAPRRKSGFLLNNLSVHQKITEKSGIVDSLKKIQELI
jgi:DNA ligase-1